MIPHISSLLGSVSPQAHFLQLPTIATDMSSQEEVVETSCHLFFYSVN